MTSYLDLLNPVYERRESDPTTSAIAQDKRQCPDIREFRSDAELRCLRNYVVHCLLLCYTLS